MTTVYQPYIHFFAGMGFRPAIQVMDRNQYGDRLIWIVGDDAPIEGKAPADSSDAYVWGTWLPQPGPPVAQLTAADLAGPIAGTSFSAGPLIPGPWHPPVDYPCNCITTPPINPPLPEPAPVPLPASAGLLLMAVAALALWRRA